MQTFDNPRNRERYTVSFFLLACGISWIVWIPLALSRQELVAIRLPMPLYLLGAFGPLAAAMITSAYYRLGNPWEMVKNLFSLKASPAIYLIACAVPALAQLIAIATVMNVWGPIPELKFNSPLFVVTMFASFIIVAAGEEVGWRGFALPILQRRCSPTLATLAVWWMWGTWHIPAFFVGLKITSFSALVAMLCGFYMLLLPISFLFSWVYNRSRGKTLLCVVMHAAVAGASGASNTAGLRPVKFFCVYGCVFALMASGLFFFGTWKSAAPVRLNLDSGKVEPFDGSCQ